MPWTRFLALGLLAGMLAAKLEIAGGILLVRPVRVYESLIRGVHDYFNNTCIILLHGTPNPVDSEGLEQVDGLLALQRYLSARLNIRTAIMDLKTFQTRVGKTYRRIKRPLFVLLNDLEEVEEQFVLVSDWIAMAYPTWLVVLREQTAFEDFLSRVHVPFDCLLMVAQTVPGGTGEIVRDVYRIHRGDELRSMYFGSWDEVRGFRGPRAGFYQRRNNLYGHNLRIASIDNSPVSWLVRNSLGETIDVRGFFGEVLRLLREGMNCTFTYESAPSWGVRLTNGTWTGLIGALLDGHADLAATELMMTSDRMDVVRFTTPVYSTRCRTYIKRPESMAVKWNAYAAPFAAEIWKFVGLLVAVVAATIAGMKAFLGSRAAAEFPRDSDRAPSNFLETAFYVFGAFCGQGMEPSSLDPVRLVELSVHLTAVVIVAAYSAALISFLAVKTFVMPFATMRGLLEDGTYRFAVVAESADYSFFQNTTDEVMAVMFDELLRKEEDLPRTYLDGLRRVCEESKYAFMTMDTMAAVLRDKVDCILEPLDAIMQTTIAMATPADSPYGGIINSNILLLRDSGILQRLLRLEWLSETSTAKSQWASVELEDVVPLLVFLLLAFSLTWLLLLFERFADRLGRNRLNGTVGNAARTKIPRMVSVPVGKENVAPAGRRPTKTRPKENAARPLGRRFCGGLESEKRPDGGIRGRLGPPSILKEAPFRVHRDDENSAAVREGKLRLAAVRKIVPLAVVASEEAKARRPSQIPRWRWDRTGSTERLSGSPGRDDDGGLARLEVGKRSRSASTGDGRRIRRRSGSLVVERPVRPTAAASGHRAGAETTTRGALGGGSAADGPAKRRGKLAGEKGEGGGGGRRAEGGQVGPTDIATPLDGPPPIPPEPVKANRESKARARRNVPLGRLALGCIENRAKRINGKEEDLFPAEMLRHADYARDLPVVEREREDLGPRLSGNFLRGRFNAEQRRLVVAFLIHLSSHYRYPSFAVYQAVKLFDVAMDRAPACTVYVQLTALAALWIVLKRHQVREKVPTATAMVSLANDLYAGREGLLFEYERRILRAVDFNLSFPDAFSLYAYHLVECSRYAKIPERSTTFLRHCGGYLIDLTLLDEDLCGLSGCLVAFVAAELALGLVLDEGPAAWSTSGQPRWKFCRMLVRAASPRSGRFPSEEIVALRGAMLRRIRSSAERRSAFECVYRKYNRTKYGRISESLVRMAKTIREAGVVDP